MSFKRRRGRQPANFTESENVPSDVSFRRRPKKTPISDPHAITLDAKHKEKLKYFQDQKDSLPQLEQNVSEMESRLQQLLDIPPPERTPNDLENIYQLPKNIKKTKQSIIDIRNDKEQIDYLSKTLPLLIQYYDETAPVLVEPVKTVEKPIVNSSNVKDLISVTNSTNKGKLLNDYLEVTERRKIIYNAPDESIHLCNGCESANLVYHESDGIMVCEECGLVSKDAPFTKEYVPTFKEMQDIDRQPTFSYKKINHFHEHLQNMQAEENTQIPPNVLKAIHIEMKKEKMKPSSLNEKKVRSFLKKHGLNKYYEHAYHIICLVNGNPPLKMEKPFRDQLCLMFEEIQAPFTRHCPKDRKNFLNYKYVLYKFCELLERDEYLKYFPLLKSREKLRQQDIIWEGICNDLLWEFIPSV